MTTTSLDLQPQTICIGDGKIRWADVVAVARNGAQLALSESAWARIENSQAIVQCIVSSGRRAYGVNTGLGALSDTALIGEQREQLSHNALLSHACGVGPLLSKEQTRSIICAAVANYSQGYSGLQRCVVEALIQFLNLGVTPCVPAQGSVGYLTHMAHIGVALLGVGDVTWRGQTLSASELLKAIGMEPLRLGAKDGLSLVNGTPCMTGLSALALDDIERLADWADVIGAMSFEALRGQMDAFDAEVLALKPHPGMQQVGKNLRTLLEDSEVLAASAGVRTQDALSIRSIPQIHGACRDQIRHAAKQIEIELNSATDNPLLLGTPDSFRVVSQANPHGESVAMAADLLRIAVAEFGGVSERRMDRLLNPLVSGLPPFLVAKPGVNSGLMIAHYTAASLAADNRRKAQPAVVDNFVTSGAQEDHLSLGTTAALELHGALENLQQILAIEYLLAAQAFEFFGDQRMGIGTSEARKMLRQKIPSYVVDRFLAPEIANASSILRLESPLTALIGTSI